MNILTSITLIVISFMAGRIYEYRISNEDNETDSKLLLDVFNEISKLREENKILKEKLQDKDFSFIDKLLDFFLDKNVCECCVYDCKINDVEYDCETGIKKWLESEVEE
ncbi:hypothetical protein ABRY17_06190 [Clostridioides difficile]